MPACRFTWMPRSAGRAAIRFLAVSDIVFASQSFCERRFRPGRQPQGPRVASGHHAGPLGRPDDGSGWQHRLGPQDEQAILPAGLRIQVLDTVGAGDSFHGAMSFALAQGWPMDKAMRLATAVGAMCCLGLGGREGLPTLRQAQAFLRKAQGPGCRRTTRKTR